jgi:hypothetical protein
MTRTLARLLLLPLTLGACAGKADDTGAIDTGGSGGDDTASADGLRTLANCGGSIGSGVPEPFASWFDCVDIAVDGDNLLFQSVGLPPHKSPYYPEDDPNYEAFDTRTGDHYKNPNELSSQVLTLSIPQNPTPKGITITADMVNVSAGDSTEEYHAEVQGMGLDGTNLFTGTAAPGDDISAEEYTFDLWEGHPQNSGVYHHHGANPSALAVLVDRGVATSTTPGTNTVELFGLMCDGTVVIGCTELNGDSVSSAELDAQNGHVADVLGPDGSVFFAERYHVHACDALGRHLTPEIQYYDDGTCAGGGGPP